MYPFQRHSIYATSNLHFTSLICSDVVARGLDVPHVKHVISYDAPVDLRKYVHRVGRTARAGREGSAWTLVEEQEVRFFKEMLKSVSQTTLDRVARVRMREAELKELDECYEVRNLSRFDLSFGVAWVVRA